MARLNDRQQEINLAEKQVSYEQAYSLYENKLAEYGDTTQYGNTWKRIKEKLALSDGLKTAKIALERAQFSKNKAHIVGTSVSSG